MKIVIMGAGELGRAIGLLLREKNNEPIFWDADTTKVPGQKSLQEIIPAADAIFFCVPSWVMAKAIASVQPFLKADCLLVSFAKGIEEASQKTMSELFSVAIPAHPFAVISGPMLAEEISSGKPAAAVIASTDSKVQEQLRDLFASPRFRAEVSNDPFSVSLAGVLKNIYAVSLGIADGLQLSGNEKGWLASRAISEMLDIGIELGADGKIIVGTAGVGDFMATGYSPYSRNREVGDEIVKTGICKLPGEGLASLPALVKRLDKKGKAADFPLLGLIKKIGIDCEPAKPAFALFFNDTD